METSQASAADLSGAAAEYPRWVMFDDGVSYRHGKAGPCLSPADYRTVAYARTSTGYPVHVSFRLAAPPAVSPLNPTTAYCRTGCKSSPA
jgi:hypothetical protein